MATESERHMVASIAAHTRWASASLDDRTANGARGQRGLATRFEREVDPDGVLPPAERAARAESARKAYMTRLALKSAQARRARRGAA